MHESQPTTLADESQEVELGMTTKVYYLVHPSVDANEASSL